MLNQDIIIAQLELGRQRYGGDILPIKMKELPITERPYEKLEKYGEKMLSNAELLAIIIKSGSKEDTAIGLAQKILKLNKNVNTEDLNFLREISIEELTKIKGIGKVKAIQLKAVCELAIRMNTTINYQGKKIKSPKDIADILMGKMRFEKQEILKIVMLNNQNRIIKITDVARGGINFTKTTMKEILNEAVKVEASSIILTHNHPGGDPTPSMADIKMTEEVEKASKILGIKLIDHIVIGKMKYVSIFSQRQK